MNHFLQNSMIFIQQHPFVSSFVLLAVILAVLIATFALLFLLEGFIGLFYKQPAVKTGDTPINNKTTDGGAGACAVVCVVCI